MTGCRQMHGKSTFEALISESQSLTKLGVCLWYTFLRKDGDLEEKSSAELNSAARRWWKRICRDSSAPG